MYLYRYKRALGLYTTAVNAARDMVRPGGAVVLSPGCASFDEFDNFVHRGVVFADLANGRPPTPSAKEAAAVAAKAEAAAAATKTDVRQ